MRSSSLRRGGTAGIHVVVRLSRTSPPPRGISFLRDEGDSTDVYLMNPDGSHLRNLTGPLRVGRARHSWSPDGERVIFSVHEGPGDEDPVNLHSIRADGTGLTRLTDGGAGSLHSGEFLPDGRILLFRHLPGDTASSGWYVMQPDGSIVARYEGRVCPFSPDGGRVACVNDEGIYVMNVDGSGFVQVARERGLRYSLVGLDWSPDGMRLAYVEGTKVDYTEFFIVEIPTRTRKSIRYLYCNSTMGPQWSPDGTKLLFYMDSACGNIFPGVYTMTPDGTGLVQRTHHSNDRLPHWRP